MYIHQAKAYFFLLIVGWSAVNRWSILRALQVWLPRIWIFRQSEKYASFEMKMKPRKKGPGQSENYLYNYFLIVPCFEGCTWCMFFFPITSQDCSLLEPWCCATNLKFECTGPPITFLTFKLEDGLVYGWETWPPVLLRIITACKYGGSWIRSLLLLQFLFDIFLVGTGIDRERNWYEWFQNTILFGNAHCWWRCWGLSNLCAFHWNWQQGVWQF